MLRADELVLEPVGFFLGAAHQPGDARGSVNLPRLVGDLGGLLQDLVHAVPDRLDVNIELFQNLADQPLSLHEQGQQNMLHVPLAVLELHGHLLGRLDGFLCLFRKSFLSHGY